jgi:hypothetical protein
MIVERIHDSDTEVRKAVYKRLLPVDIRQLKISHRVELVAVGLKDRDASVKEECMAMCTKWVKDCKEVVEVCKSKSIILISSYLDFSMWSRISK